jgi:hypothetical protein
MTPGSTPFIHPLASPQVAKRKSPAMLEKFERYPLTFGPTPIERLKRLSAHLGDRAPRHGVKNWTAIRT